jgi:hypothetical protein
VPGRGPRDGHGGVVDTLETAQVAELPVGLAAVEGRLVVVSSARPSVGAVVSTIDGVPATGSLREW